MNSRYAHRKRPSQLRLSSDSALSPLPLYTTAVVADPLDNPPDYPDSAEEADVDLDSDSDEGIVRYSVSTPRRRTPRSPPPPRPKQRPRTSSADPYLDSLLARSVHALEMSNALLQSSINTQSALNSVLGSEGVQTPSEESLEFHARSLSSRIVQNTACVDDLDLISQSVDSLLEEEESTHTQDEDDSTSRSLPAPSSFSQRRSHLHKPSLDLRNSSLNYSNHDREDLISRPPRAVTMYVDSSESPTSISMPSTLGVRPPSRTRGTPLPPDGHRRPLLLQSDSESVSSSPKRAVDLLSSYVASSSTSTLLSSPSSTRTVRRTSNASSSTSTTRRSPRVGPLRSRSPSRSPARSTRSSSSRQQDIPRKWDTPPIIELPSSSSESSDDKEMEVERTLTSLRTILQNNPPKEPKGKEREQELLRPALLLSPAIGMPVADTSHATASVSRLFTKARHTHSTRPPSPPRHSSMKGSTNSLRTQRERELGETAPPTPISPVPSLSGSWLSVSDALSFKGSKGSSGRSTPNRVSFAELPTDTGQHTAKASRSRSKSRSRSRSKSRSGKDGKGEMSDGEGPWWMWLLGTNPTYARSEERLSRGAVWAPRPGFGGSIEEWGA
ncbi:hypothetical protein BDY19DRAFT_1056821 [Irpex rosettiformis]|uniref:Uncharacterized protein n=1 Tax=Irpex rosettiformis TaxID=378272 RepID=A0ACB8U4N7_9APHY|nr:hypothetical protein BDY19DRAFT_1056821 [Irpex rosettiformis]